MNYLLGIFEGANDPSFSDSVPLSMIKESGKLNEVNLIDVDTPNTYKYVRYVPPNKNYSDISPIKIIGHNVNQAAEDTKKKRFSKQLIYLYSIYIQIIQQTQLKKISTSIVEFWLLMKEKSQLMKQD